MSERAADETLRRRAWRGESSGLACNGGPTASPHTKRPRDAWARNSLLPSLVHHDQPQDAFFRNRMAH